MSNLKSKKTFIKGKINKQCHKVIVHKLQEELPTATQSDTNTPGASLILFLFFLSFGLPLLFFLFCLLVFAVSVTSQI